MNYAISRDDNKNGVLIASDNPITPLEYLNIDDQYRKLVLGIKTHNINLIGVFCNDERAVDYFHKKFISLASECVDSEAIITGDFNYGARSSDKTRYDKIQNLVDAGWHDVWRKFYGGAITDSCWTHRNQSFLSSENSGYSLVDHFLVSNPLISRIVDKPVNDQSVLRKKKDDSGFSDHSIISIKVRLKNDLKA